MRRDLLILIGLFAALALVIALGPGRASSVPGWSTSSHASGPPGALALYRWLEALDYDVGRLQYTERFAPDPQAALLIVLGPSERYSREEAAAVAAWVADGGTLLLADEQPGRAAASALLFAAFELELVPAAEQFTELAPVLQPVLARPPAHTIATGSRVRLRTPRDDVAPLVGADDAPMLLGLRHGEGYVFASAALFPFTNRGLAQDDNAALVLNLLRRVPAGARVVFDEYHHGFVRAPSLRSLLLGTAWGWAILYTALVLAAYLAFTGRRFGRAIPLQAEAARRSSAEYMESMAGLLRRAGRREALQAHYRTSFKRRLARASGLSPQLDDETLLAALAEVAPHEASRAQAVLSELAGPVADEARLLHLVAEADRLGQAR